MLLNAASAPAGLSRGFAHVNLHRKHHILKHIMDCRLHRLCTVYRSSRHSDNIEENGMLSYRVAERCEEVGT